MDQSVKRGFRFGPFQLDPDERTLRNGEERLDLPPRVFDTLLVLVSRSGHLVEKDRLMQEVWPDTAVEENNLTQAVYLLRKVLRDGESGERYIETVPKRGYRFVARVQELGSAPDSGNPSQLQAKPNSESASVRRRQFPSILGAIVLLVLLSSLALFVWKKRSPAPGAAGGTRSIAVLPMQNLSGDPSQEYFADGFTEELVTDLAQVHSLRVISRTSVMPYKGSKKPLPQIAQELHVNLVLEGSVARSGNRVRVTAQLINAQTDTHLWAHAYDSDVKDVLDIQSQISRAIVEDVSLDLSPEERERLATVPTVDPEAHDLYLKASYQFAQQTPESLKQSLLLYQEAVKRDPSFALAYLGIAQTENSLLQITAVSPEVAVPHVKEALNKALDINPHLGDAHGMLASIAYYYDWDWPRADQEFRLALREGARAPTEGRYGIILCTRGRFAEGEEHIRTAMELDPLGKTPRVNHFFALYFQRKYPQARKEQEELVAASPDFLAGHLLLGLVAVLQGDCAEVANQAQWSEKRFPTPVAKWELAVASYCRGDLQQARRYLEQAAISNGPAFASPYQLALGYALVGDKDTALSYLQKSADAHEGQILYLKYEPIFDGIRSDPRYVTLEQRIGLLP